MSQPPISWNHVFDADQQPLSVVDSRRRLRWILAGFVLGVAVVLARLFWLEVSTGAQVRRHAAQLPSETVFLPATRGRIETRDGVVLAEDRQAAGLTMHYRYLQQPPDPHWLHRQARRRLDRRARRDPAQVEAEEAKLRVELIDLHRRLASLTGLSHEQWQARCAHVRRLVERIAQSVNQRIDQRYEQQQFDRQRVRVDWNSLTPLEKARQAVREALFEQGSDAPPEAIEVAEQQQHHLLVARLSDVAVAAIENEPDRFPGLRIEHQRRRQYPQGTLAAHLVGHMGKVNSAELQRQEIHSADDWVGRMGLEELFETQLRGTRGKQLQVTDRRGRELSSHMTHPAQSGRGLTLTIDSRLQRSAEKLLDQALERGPTANRDAHIAGGAVVVLDCQTGQVLACASAPRFDPNVMLGGSPAALEPLLAGAHRPLFDRATKMALPPGSVMKLVTAAALLESGAVTADEQFHCQGFLHQPDRQRCYLFRHHGVGHGRITLTDALAQSCNVYFFHHATRMGHRPLIDWAYRFGLGQRTGIELPGETSGRVPTPRSMEKLEDREWTASDTQALSIGQSSLTVTPLQMARLVAAVANGGRLVRPRLLVQQDETADSYPDDPLVGLSESTLKAIRTGMRLAVADPSGTAHEVLASASVHVAAKTGTAETGNSKGDHAWIAAYAPATAPKIALVVVLEHAGSGSTAAGPVANRLVLRLDQLGYFSRPDARVARHPNKTE